MHDSEKLIAFGLTLVVHWVLLIREDETQIFTGLDCFLLLNKHDHKTLHLKMIELQIIILKMMLYQNESYMVLNLDRLQPQVAAVENDLTLKNNEK